MVSQLSFDSNVQKEGQTDKLVEYMTKINSHKRKIAVELFIEGKTEFESDNHEKKKQGFDKMSRALQILLEVRNSSDLDKSKQLDALIRPHLSDYNQIAQDANLNALQGLGSGYEIPEFINLYNKSLYD